MIWNIPTINTSPCGKYLTYLKRSMAHSLSGSLFKQLQENEVQVVTVFKFFPEISINSLWIRDIPVSRPAHTMNYINKCHGPTYMPHVWFESTTGRLGNCDKQSEKLNKNFHTSAVNRDKRHSGVSKVGSTLWNCVYSTGVHLSCSSLFRSTKTACADTNMNRNHR